MGAPPFLTPEERSNALAKAARARTIRAQVKEKLRKGEISVFDVLETSDEVIGKMKVKNFLETLPGVGAIRARTIMEKLHISPARRIRGLGVIQKAALKKELSEHSFVKSAGRLIVLSGPGGVGKSTVAEIIKSDIRFHISVSATTRKARPGEIEGVHYFFLTDKEFDVRTAHDEFLEWAEFAGARYGTPARPVRESLRSGIHVLLEIEIAGARQVKAHMPDAILVFLEPPSWEELKSRIIARGIDSPERIESRLHLAQNELGAAGEFDFRVVNHRVEEVVARLVALATG